MVCLFAIIETEWNNLCPIRRAGERVTARKTRQCYFPNMVYDLIVESFADSHHHSHVSCSGFKSGMHIRADHRRSDECFFAEALFTLSGFYNFMQLIYFFGLCFYKTHSYSNLGKH